MKYAIIAAGEGSRLASEGIGEPKPLVRINGEPLVDRLIRVFMDNNATEILVICNNLTPLVSDHLALIQRQGLSRQRVPLRYVVKTTPSSMHSFYELSSLMDKEPFVLTTVDTIFREDDFHRYVEHFTKSIAATGGAQHSSSNNGENGIDGLMGVTDFIDDEKPLYVGTDAEMNITGFFDSYDSLRKNEGTQVATTPTYISGGIYGLTAPALRTLNGCMVRGESRMRNYQRALIRDGLRLKAFAFSKVLDIDHASDIAKAEAFLCG